MIILFHSCKTENFQEEALFFSTVEKNDTRSIKKFISEIKDIDKKKIYSILNKENVSDKYKDISIQFNLLNSLIVSHQYIKASEVIVGLNQMKDLPLILNDVLKLKNLKIQTNSYFDNSKLLDKYELYFQSNKSQYGIYLYSRFLLEKSFFLWARSEYKSALACAQYSRHLLKKNNLLNQYPQTNIDLLSIITFIFSEDESQKEISKDIYRFRAKQNDILGHPFESLMDSIFLENLTKSDSTVLSNLKYVYNKATNLKNKREICSNLIAKLAEFKKFHFLYENHKEFGDQIKDFVYSKSQKAGYLILALAASVEEDRELSNLYIRKANQVISSSEIESTWNRYYHSSTMFEINCSRYFSEYNSESLDSALIDIQEQFNLADLLFQDKSDFHLDDFHMLLTLDLISIFSENNSYPMEYILQFFEFLAKAKLQNVKLQTAKRSYYDDNITSLRDSINYIIAKKEDQISQWNNVMDASSPIYEDLYFLYSKRAKCSTTTISLPKLNLKNLNSTLKSQNALYFEYLSTEDQLGAYTIDSKGVKFYTYDFIKVDSLSRIINSSYKTLTYEQLTEIKKELFQFDINEYSNLYVSPSGPTNNLPLTALLNSNQTLTNVIGPESIEKLTRSIIDKKNSSVFCFNDNKTLRKKINNSNSQEPFYTRLPYSFESVIEINKMLNKDATNYFGENFTKKTVLENLSSDIVHLSTHGLTNKSVINDNAIVVWKNGSPEQMRTLSFDNQKKYPKFIYLDGCNTAIGAHQIGEGTFSLSRIFAKNGVETMIKTLWPIDDESSAFFSKSYYKNWITGISAGEAFHLAQQQTKAEYPQPYHWAPFVLEGNPNLYLSQD